MFHLKYPRFHGFFSWDELGCLSRAVGFPVDLFQTNLIDEIHVEENGLPYNEVLKMLDYKLLYKAVHMTANLHTADWNTCVIRRAAQILNHKALSYEDIYNARVAYQAYEDGDMKGMLLKQRILMRTLKMCGKTISPMKLMHRIKHSQHSFDEPRRIQLYELIDLILWAHGYETYVPAERYGHFEMEEDLFKLVDFDQLLSHHDEKLANRLDAQYLKDEWEFSKERVGNKSKFRDPTVICGDSRVQMARNQKKKYRSLRSAVGDSEKMLYCCKYGFVRERPKTAPEFSTKVSEDRQSRKISSAAHNAILQKMQRVFNYSEYKRPKEKSFHVDLSDKPVLKDHKRSETPKVVTREEVTDTAERWDRLMFDIETEGSRHEIHKMVEMDHFIPGYCERKEDEEQQKLATKHTIDREAMVSRAPSSKATSAKRRVEHDDKINALAYPVARIPPSHGKKCDARFRGWYDIRSRRGQHYVLVTPYFQESPKGHLFRKLTKDSNTVVKKVHGDFVHRYTDSSHICQRPVTAPAVMTMTENQVILKRNSSRYRAESSGYASMEETEDDYDDTQQDQAEEIDENIEKEAETEEENQVDLGIVTDIGGTPKEKQEICDAGKDIRYKVLKGSPTSGQDIDPDSQSLESVETTLSDRIKLMANFQEPYDINDGRPRAKSALTPRNKGLENGMSNLNDDREVVRRSKSAAGNYRKTDLEPALPVPYMDHSKPRVVSVGSIGKISLLENISEARYWEDTIKEEEKPQEETVEDHAKHQEELDKNKHEQSTGEKQNKHAKQEENQDEPDIAELIRREERKRRQKIAMRTYYYMSAALKELKKQRSVASPKTSARSHSSNESDNGKHDKHNRHNTGKYHDGKMDKNNASKKYGHGKTGKQLNSQTKNSNQHGRVPASVLSRGIRNDSPKKSVTVDEKIDSNKNEQNIAQNKYERLLKRMGDDMPLDMKRKMMGEKVILETEKGQIGEIL